MAVQPGLTLKTGFLRTRLNLWMSSVTDFSEVQIKVKKKKDWGNTRYVGYLEIIEG